MLAGSPDGGNETSRSQSSQEVLKPPSPGTRPASAVPPAGTVPYIVKKQ